MTAVGRRAVFGLIWLLLAAGCGGGGGEGAFGLRSAGGGPADYRYVIPAGSGDAQDRGESIDILPASLDAKVGEVIEIINEDDRGHLVGAFFVGAGETVRQEFSSPGTFSGTCSVHPSGQIVITVT